jgi:SPRY domain-containing SOCS box protein 1/4
VARNPDVSLPANRQDTRPPRRTRPRARGTAQPPPAGAPVLSREPSLAHPGDHPSGNIRPSKFDAVLLHPPLDQETLEKHSWNPDDRSLNIFVKEDDRLTFHRHPVAQSTDCIRGKVGYSRGFHVWKITWPQRMRGTHAVIGLATKTAPLHHAGYVSLIGQTPDSYGWDLSKFDFCYVIIIVSVF